MDEMSSHSYGLLSLSPPQASPTPISNLLGLDLFAPYIPSHENTMNLVDPAFGTFDNYFLLHCIEYYPEIALSTL